MFHFLTLTYNHEKYIIEHLESIKFQIEEYSLQKPLLTVCDDCSTDNTLYLLKEWISKNIGLFEKVKILENSVNRGIVKNYLRTVNNIDSERFKILAGDDLYYKNCVLEVNAVSDLIATTVIEFDGLDMFKYNYFYSDGISTKTKVKHILDHGNPFAAPGIFYKKNLIQDRRLQEFISNFKWIEDLPTWQYLFRLNKNSFSYSAIRTPYIMYRNNSGIYGNKKVSDKKKMFLDEENLLYEKYGNRNNNVKFSRVFKYLNPVKYANKIMYFISYRREEICLEREAKQYYDEIKSRSIEFINCLKTKL